LSILGACYYEAQYQVTVACTPEYNTIIENEEESNHTRRAHTCVSFNIDASENHQSPINPNWMKKWIFWTGYVYVRRTSLQQYCQVSVSIKLYEKSILFFME
jgi:hypothetical protein